MKKFRSRWDKPKKPSLTIFEDRTAIPWQHYIVEDGKKEKVARSWAEDQVNRGKAKYSVVNKNPKSKTRTVGYNAKAVDAQIAASNRAGKRIGGKERKLIHRLLQGRVKLVSK